MIRKSAEQRFRDLIRSAAQVFLAQGYRRTQMADVAQAMGVAKGTVYLYVESKEALFDLVLRYADCLVEPEAMLSIELPPILPVPTPDPESTLLFVKEQLIQADPAPLLTTALQKPQFDQVQAELTGIIRQLFAKLNRHRISMKLIDRCAHDYPELAAVFFQAGRQQVLQALIRYLELHIQRGTLRSVPDVPVAARIIIETIAYWAIHRYWDPSPQSMNDQVAEATVVHMLIYALVPEK